MAVPYRRGAQRYAAGVAGATAPHIAALDTRISGLNTRLAGVPGAVNNLFSGAATEAANVGTNVSNLSTNFLSGLSGLASSLPGMSGSSDLGLAARGMERGVGTASYLGSVLGTQVGQERANATLAAQQRLSDEIMAQQDQQWQLKDTAAQTRADWMPYANQFAQLAQAPIQERAARLANAAAMGSIDSTILNNLAAMKQLGLSQADIIKARRLYGNIRARAAGSPHGGSGGNNPTPTAPETVQAI